MLNRVYFLRLSSTVDQGAEAAAKQEDSGFPFQSFSTQRGRNQRAVPRCFA